MNMAKLVSFFNGINASHLVDILAKEKLAKVAEDVKASGRKLRSFPSSYDIPIIDFQLQTLLKMQAKPVKNTLMKVLNKAKN